MINWFTVFTLPPSYPYKAHVISWFYVSDPIYARAYRIRETGGYTLDIEELYFNSISQDTTMSEVSRYEYLTYPNKSQIGRPTIYYVDYQRTPSLYIWQTAAPMYNLPQIIINNTLTVALTGSTDTNVDFNSIKDALNSITGATSANTYTVKVARGLS